MKTEPNLTLLRVETPYGVSLSTRGAGFFIGEAMAYRHELEFTDKLCFVKGKNATAILDLDSYGATAGWKFSFGLKYVNLYRRRRDGAGYEYVTLSRFLMQAKDDDYVDHINRNPLDNRICNLRICTASQNQSNRVSQKNNHSGFKGVYRGRLHWYARIKLGKTRLFLGAYAKPEDAARSYDAMARVLHKAFAVLNFPDELRTPEEAMSSRLAPFDLGRFNLLYNPNNKKGARKPEPIQQEIQL